MEKMPLVSVIIPIYNVECYLDTCIISVVYQTYSNLEIILVDDGSPDNSPEICDVWAEKDSRITVVHKENGGLSDARNTGLRYANGEYIAFVDSDDWISINMIENMVHAMLRYQADMVICQFVNVYPDGRTEKSFSEKRKEEILNQNQVLELLSEDEKITSHVWRKLYKRAYIPEGIFPVGKNFEDIYVMPDLVLPCKKFVYLSDGYYFYRFNEKGIVRSLKLEDLFDLYDAIEVFYRKTKYFLGGRAEEFITNKKIALYCSCINSGASDINLIKYSKKRIRNDLRHTQFCFAKGYKNKGFLFAIKYMSCFDRILFSIFTRVKGSCLRVIKLCYLSMVFIRKYQKIKGPKFLVLCTPQHGNLGDRALLEAERKFVEEYFPEYTFFSLPLEISRGIKVLRRFIHKQDIVALQAGGNIGTLYPGIHRTQEKVIRCVSKKINFIFPQTFFYSDNKQGKKFLERTKKLYSSCKCLKVFVRDNSSYEFIKRELPSVEVVLKPDMALMCHYDKRLIRQNRALLCLRNDGESTLTNSEKENILKYASKHFLILKQIDTHVYYDIPNDNEAGKYIMNVWDEMAASEIIFTDRLHAMLFAVITNTPCVVFLSKSSKTEGVYEWIKDCDYIRLIYDIRELDEAVREVLRCSEKEFVLDKIQEEFDGMAKQIKLSCMLYGKRGN